MKTSVIIDGQVYYKVSVAAKLLRTTPAKVRKLMGDESLEWSQARVNGSIVVSQKSLVRYMKAQEAGGR